MPPLIRYERAAMEEYTHRKPPCLMRSRKAKSRVRGVRECRLARGNGGAVLAGIADGPPPENDAFEGVTSDQAAFQRLKYRSEQSNPV